MSEQDPIKTANWAGTLLGKGLNAGLSTVKTVGGWGASLGSVPLKAYGRALASNPLGTVAGTAGMAVSAPYLYGRFRGTEYEQGVNAAKPPHDLSWAPGRTAQASYDEGTPMNYTDRMRQEFLEKKASLAEKIKDLPLGVALPLGAAAWFAGQMGSSLLKPSTDIMGQNIARNVFPQDARLGLDDEAARAEAASRGKTIGTENANSLLSEHANKQYTNKERNVLAPARSGLLRDLANDDKIIMRGLEDPYSKKVIHDTLATVRTFAPSLSMDKKTMQSVLREALTSPEGGLSYQTIKQLADTQHSVSDNKLPSLIED